MLYRRARVWVLVWLIELVALLVSYTIDRIVGTCSINLATDCGIIYIPMRSNDGREGQG